MMKQYLLSYCVTLGLLAIAFSLSYFFGKEFGQSSVFLIFLPVIAVASWAFGRKVGLAATSLASIAIAYFFLPVLSSSTESGLIQIYLFFALGLFLNIVLDARGNNELMQSMRKREKDALKRVIDLEQKYAVAQQEIKARDEFLSIASHELKTPLTSMLLQLQRALHNIRNVSLANFSVENLLKMLEGAERQTSRLSKMINDLLNVSLMSTHKMDLEIETFNISDLTREVVDSFSERFEKEGYKPRTSIQPAIQGKWDKIRVEQAITNLISNAIKYGEGKPIAISLSNSHNSVKISVNDQGLGIPDNLKERVFALFERGKMTNNKVKGLGVGLYITNEIVKAHKGRIEVKSKEGEGSSFTIELPLKTTAIA